MRIGSGAARLSGPIGSESSGTLAFPIAALAVLAVMVVLANPLPQGLSFDNGSSTPTAADSYGKLPLSFVANKGQVDQSVRYYAQDGGASVYFTDNKAVLSLEKGERGQALELRFVGANPNATVTARHKASGTVNYLVGDEAGHQRGLATYNRIVYANLWPGIDMVFKGAGGKLEYEFVLEPGANPNDIQLAWGGANGVSVDDGGRLQVATALGNLTDARPRTFQRIGGHKVPVQSSFALDRGGNPNRSYGFHVGAYDHHRTLVIDPALAYSTYLGGTAPLGAGNDSGNGITVDAAGNAYVTGGTGSLNYPTTVGAFDVLPGGGTDAFVTKLSDDGASLVYSTYLGGTADDESNGIAVDGAGSAYVTGRTDSTDFPTAAAYDASANGGVDAFVTKLSSDGSALTYSTYVGGSGDDVASGIGIDGAGPRAYVTGNTSSSDLPTTGGAFDTSFNGAFDAFVTKLDAAGSALAYSTYLGGSSGDLASGIAVNAAGNAFLVGQTSSSDLPTTLGAFATGSGGSGDAFVAKLAGSGSTLDYSTYLGGFGTDVGLGIALDSIGSAYVTGYNTLGGFPTTPAAYDTTSNGGLDAFVTKLNPTGSSLFYSTYLGAASTDQGFGIAVDRAGTAWVAGYTGSSAFPTTGDAYDATKDGLSDAFVTRLNQAGSVLRYSTFLGGTIGDFARAISLDADGGIYVSGDTESVDFPTTAGAFDTAANGSTDAFVTKLFEPVAPLYPRPGGGTPLRIPLVPEYEQCTAPNGAHIAPLDLGSCSPVAPGSDLLTTSTIGRGDGSAALKVLNGNTSTPTDEADVTLEAALTDVRNTAGGGDYTGKVILTSQLRMTDTNNGASGDDAATVSDFEFSVPIDCLATAPPERGSNCSIATTLDTLVPGFVKEGVRTVVSALSIYVEDAGVDGSVTPGAGSCPPTCGSGDEGVFLRQGLFAP